MSGTSDIQVSPYAIETTDTGYTSDTEYVWEGKAIYKVGNLFQDAILGNIWQENAQMQMTGGNIQDPQNHVIFQLIRNRKRKAIGNKLTLRRCVGNDWVIPMIPLTLDQRHFGNDFSCKYCFARLHGECNTFEDLQPADYEDDVSEEDSCGGADSDF